MESQLHFAEMATFGGRPHSYPEWLCGLLHKKYFYSCWSGAREWQSHVHCGYCQKCRHFTNEKLRYNWMPSDEKPHVFHVQAWSNGTTQIKTNELYLHEILNFIEILATDRCKEPANVRDYGELRIEMTTSNGGYALQWPINTLSKQMRERVLSRLFIIYQGVLRGESEIPAEQRWWHKLEGVI